MDKTSLENLTRGLIRENPTFVMLLGMCPTLGVTTSAANGLGMGLAISSVTRSQFLSCQIALVVSFLPAVILSGFLFDLRSVPLAARIVGNILPATYYMDTVPVSFNFWLFLLLNVGTLLASLLMLLGPSLLITRIRPASSMRYE